MLNLLALVVEGAFVVVASVYQLVAAPAEAPPPGGAQARSEASESLDEVARLSGTPQAACPDSLGCYYAEPVPGSDHSE